VYPSGVGLFAIHSLAYGVPLLLADVIHKPEAEVLIQGRNCELFCADNASALAEKLTTLIAKPDKLSAMGQYSIEDVTAKYSVENMSDTFLRTFEYVLTQSRQHLVKREEWR
jgi:glycosyltransferase involved in cell wall biosynthesis